MPASIDRKLIKELHEREEKRLQEQTPESAKFYQRAKASLVKGVASSYQVRDPYPIYFTHGLGSRVWDVDGREVSDFHNAFGCMVQGHANPAIVEAVTKRMELGSQLALPTEDSVVVAEHLQRNRLHECRLQSLHLDVGSSNQRRFTNIADDSWNSLRQPVQHLGGTRFQQLVDFLARHAEAMRKVALGFDCGERLERNVTTQSLAQALESRNCQLRL